MPHHIPTRNSLFAVGQIRVWPNLDQGRYRDPIVVIPLTGFITQILLVTLIARTLPMSRVKVHGKCSDANFARRVDFGRISLA